ncbi:MAG: hypothetical protein M1269_03940, partial [Chloroflexi bacterium]|nr:hypothetical protein [Chloroflexota bacterium]
MKKGLIKGRGIGKPTRKILTKPGLIRRRPVETKETLAGKEEVVTVPVPAPEEAPKSSLIKKAKVQEEKLEEIITPVQVKEVKEAPAKAEEKKAVIKAEEIAGKEAPKVEEKVEVKAEAPAKAAEAPKVEEKVEVKAE